MTGERIQSFGKTREEYYAGLLARARMYEDIESKKIVARYVPVREGHR